MMLRMIEYVLTREHPRPNHGNVHGLMRSEDRAPMAQPGDVHGRHGKRLPLHGCGCFSRPDL